MPQYKREARLGFGQTGLHVADRNRLLGEHYVPVRQGDGPWICAAIHHHQPWQALAVFICDRAHALEYPVRVANLPILLGLHLTMGGDIEGNLVPRQGELRVRVGE